MELQNPSNNELLKNFIFHCTKFRSRQILKLLKSKSIITGMPNKLKFYSSLSYMIDCMKKNSKGSISCKCEKVTWMKKEFNCLRFYDEIHNYARLSIIVVEMDNKIYFQTLPF